MASDTAAAPASSASAAPADPLEAGLAAFREGFDALDLSGGPSGEDTVTTADERASVTDSTETTEQAPEQGTTTGTDTSATTEETKDPPEPVTEDPPLKPKDEATLAALREKDPELHREMRKLLQSVGDRASELAYQRLKREQATTTVKQETADSGLQAAYDEMAPDARSTWVETLPEFIAAKASLAIDLARMLGVDPRTITAEVASDPEALTEALLSGHGKTRQEAAIKAAVEKAVAGAVKDADEAGYRRGKAEARGTGNLPANGEAAKPGARPILTVDDAFRQMNEGLRQIAAA